LLDQLGDQRDDARLNDAGAGGDDPKRGISLLFDELAEGRSVGKPAIEAVERLKEPFPAAPAGLLLRVGEKRLGRADENLADQALA
jgi:hypothetical protein